MPTEQAFVGRAHELAVLQAELQRARAGEPRLVWLTGEAGIGKSSLLQHFVSQVRGARVLLASGDENEIDLAYGVVAQLVGDLPADAGAVTPLELHPGAEALAVGAALVSTLGSLQAGGPVLLVVDDAQWADTRSAQALVFLLRRLRRDHVLALLSSRLDAPSSLQLWDRALAQSQLTTRLPLGGLTAEDLRQLAPAADGLALSPAASRRLLEHTGGHPLYARALLAELPAEALVERAGVLPAPRSLASVVLVRLAKLSPDAQALVLAVAVLGSRCARSDAIRVADVSDPVAALDEAVGAGLLVDGPPGHPGDVAFSHVLFRSAVYADLPLARRHALHERAAEVLGGAAALAHRVAAAVPPDPGLARELEALGRTEMSQQNWRPAADHLLAAADLSGTADDKGLRLARAVMAMLADGDIARASRSESALRAVPPSAARSRALGEVALFTGRLPTAREELSEAAALGQADGAEPADQAVVAACLGLLSMIEGDVGQAVEHSLDALLAEPSAEVAALARFALVLSMAAQGRQEELLAVVDATAGDGVAPASGPERTALQGMLAFWAGEERTAVAALSEVLRDAPPGLLFQGRDMLIFSLAEALYRLGDWDGAATHADLAISLAEDAGIRLGLGVMHAIASYVASGRGSWPEAESHVAEATRSALVLPWWAGRAYAATAQATLAHARGDYVGMRAALQTFGDPAVRDRVEGLGSTNWRVLLIEAMLELGELDEAEGDLQALEIRIAHREGSTASLEAWRLRGRDAELRGHEAAARRAYERGLALAVEFPLALSRARLELAYGRFLLEHGDRRPAVDRLRAAHRSLERLRAKPFLTACEELLHAAGLRPPTRGAPLDLTLQELAVARLVAAGRTNSEVGGELFITSRTVAFHLSNIYAKAGISSRRHLAERFPELLS